MYMYNRPECRHQRFLDDLSPVPCLLFKMTKMMMHPFHQVTLLHGRAWTTTRLIARSQSTPPRYKQSSVLDVRDFVGKMSVLALEWFARDSCLAEQTMTTG